MEQLARSAHSRRMNSTIFVYNSRFSIVKPSLHIRQVIIADGAKFYLPSQQPCRTKHSAAPGTLSLSSIVSSPHVLTNTSVATCQTNHLKLQPFHCSFKTSSWQTTVRRGIVTLRKEGSVTPLNSTALIASGVTQTIDCRKMKPRPRCKIHKKCKTTTSRFSATHIMSKKNPVILIKINHMRFT